MRRDQRGRLPLWIPAFGLLLAGCSGREPYQRGQELLAAGDRDAAVAAMRQAVAQDPANAQYQIELGDAETAAAEEHLERARTLLSAGRLVEGRAELEQTLDFMPGHPQAVTMLARLEADPITVMPPPPRPRARPEKTGGAGQPSSPELAQPAEVAAAGPAEAATDAGPQPVEPRPPAAQRVQPTSVKPAPPLRRRVPASNPAPALTPLQPRRTALPNEVPTAAPAPAPAERDFPGIVSRDDSRYPKEMQTLDGISLKLKDTGKDPVHADIEIRVGDFTKRYNNLRAGARINGRGVSRRPYQLVITSINTRTETISFIVAPIRLQ